jgi:hypothetical protein
MPSLKLKYENDITIAEDKTGNRVLIWDTNRLELQLTSEEAIKLGAMLTAAGHRVGLGFRESTKPDRRQATRRQRDKTDARLAARKK